MPVRTVRGYDRCMTSENERVVRRIVELFNQLDADPKARNASGEFEELLGLIDPEIEFLPDRVQIDAGAHRGLTAALHFWDEWFTLWEEHRFEITEIEGRGNSVLVLGHNRLKGRDGIVIDWKNQSIFTLSGGRVTHYRDFLDEEAARRAFEAGSGD